MTPALDRLLTTAGGAVADVRGTVSDVRGAVAGALGRPQQPWGAADVPDQTGRTVLVTGANSGLGLQVSLTLARAGARVLMTARDAGRGEIARARVAATAVGPAPEVVALDLADPDSVRSAAADVIRRTDRLDTLVANAGVMMTPLTRTGEGLELQFATNHLGHFSLTGLLLPLLLAADAGNSTRDPSAEPDPATTPTPVGSVTPTGAHPRVVVVSSVAARGGRVQLSDLQFERRSYTPFGAYAQSKLADLLFARELQRRADDAGARLLVAAAHPGLSATSLYSNSGLGRIAAVGAVATRAIGLVGQDDADGALPLLYAATMPDVRPGEYFGPSSVGQFRGSPTRVPAPAAAADDATAAALWLASEDLSGVRYAWS